MPTTTLVTLPLGKVRGDTLNLLRIDDGCYTLTISNRRQNPLRTITCDSTAITELSTALTRWLNEPDPESDCVLITLTDITSNAIMQFTTGRLAGGEKCIIIFPGTFIAEMKETFLSCSYEYLYLPEVKTLAETLTELMRSTPTTSPEPPRVVTDPYLEITVITTANSVRVRSPYAESFIERARRLNGTWDKTRREWEFGRDQLDEVHTALADVYGFSTGPTHDVTLHLTELPYDWAASSDAQLKHRRLLKRFQRDWSVDIDDGVEILEGKFRRRGGSSRNPVIGQIDEPLTLRIEHLNKLQLDQLREILADELATGKARLTISDTTNTAAAAGPRTVSFGENCTTASNLDDLKSNPA